MRRKFMTPNAVTGRLKSFRLIASKPDGEIGGGGLD
jgi:hypothetical protein